MRIFRPCECHAFLQDHVKRKQGAFRKTVLYSGFFQGNWSWFQRLDRKSKFKNALRTSSALPQSRAVIYIPSYAHQYITVRDAGAVTSHPAFVGSVPLVSTAGGGGGRDLVEPGLGAWISHCVCDCRQSLRTIGPQPCLPKYRARSYRDPDPVLYRPLHGRPVCLNSAPLSAVFQDLAGG